MLVANLGGSVEVVDLANGGSGERLVRLDRDDPQTRPADFTLPDSSLAAALDDGIVWIARLGVFAVGADTASVVRTTDASAAPRGIAVADGDVWVGLSDEAAAVTTHCRMVRSGCPPRRRRPPPSRTRRAPTRPTPGGRRSASPSMMGLTSASNHDSRTSMRARLEGSSTDSGLTSR